MPSTEELINAIHQGDIESVEAMLLADPGLAESRDGFSPILTALYDRQDEIADALVEESAGLTVFEAAAMGNIFQLNARLDEDLSRVNAISTDGWTPLHLACYFHQPGAVSLLLERGADMEIVSTNATAVTPLQSALSSGAGPIARTLIERGANIHIAGWSPLHYAAANNLPDIAEILIQRGADVNAMNPEGDTPLALALRSGHLETAAILEEAGARQGSGPPA